MIDQTSDKQREIMSTRQELEKNKALVAELYMAGETKQRNNSDLQTKIDDLERLNKDIKNLRLSCIKKNTDFRSGDGELLPDQQQSLLKLTAQLSEAQYAEETKSNLNFLTFQTGGNSPTPSLELPDANNEYFNQAAEEDSEDLASL